MIKNVRRVNHFLELPSLPRGRPLRRPDMHQETVVVAQYFFTRRALAGLLTPRKERPSHRMSSPFPYPVRVCTMFNITVMYVTKMGKKCEALREKIAAPLVDRGGSNRAGAHESCRSRAEEAGAGGTHTCS